MRSTLRNGIAEAQSRMSDHFQRPTGEALNYPAAPTRAFFSPSSRASSRPSSFELQRVVKGDDESVSGDSAILYYREPLPEPYKSRPATPEPPSQPDVPLPTVWAPYMNRFRLMTLCLAQVGSGMNDGAAGALIPSLEKYYNIGYSVVSLIFVGQAVGFVVAAVMLDVLRAKLGSAKILALGWTLMTLAYVPMAAAAPFAVVAISFSLIGFGTAINVAMGNTFSGGLQNGTLMLGLFHGSYGIGGTTGPLIATALVEAAKTIWSRYYLITMGTGVAVVILSLWSFWNYDREPQSAARRKKDKESRISTLLGSMMASLRTRVVLLGAIFIFAYQGAEVSISGWVISFLIETRGGDPASVGYVSAGFWAGITVGRFVLSGPAQRIGEKMFAYGLIGGTIAFQIMVWLIPNIIGEAIAVAIVGVLLGPVYPCAATVFMRAMSSGDVLSGMSAISACGSLGGALCPFLTGLLAEKFGTFVLHPIAIALFVVMLPCLYFTPPPIKKND